MPLNDPRSFGIERSYAGAGTSGLVSHDSTRSRSEAIIGLGS